MPAFSSSTNEILAALIASSILFLLTPLISRVCRSSGKFRCLAVAHLALAPSVILVLNWLEGPRALTPLGVIFSLYYYGFMFYGLWIHVYALADRGFSLNLLSILDSLGGEASIEEICNAYGAGSGLTFAYDKRLEQLLDRSLILKNGDWLHLSPKARPLIWARGVILRLFPVRHTG